MRSRQVGERGSALPFVVLMVAIAAGAALLLAQLGQAAVARAQARTAADAAALAGAAEGEVAAREVAVANGGELVGFEQLGADTRVVVRLGPAEATARATRQLGGEPGDPGG